MKLNTASSAILITFLYGADAFTAPSRGSTFVGPKIGVRLPAGMYILLVSWLVG